MNRVNLRDVTDEKPAWVADDDDKMEQLKALIPHLGIWENIFSAQVERELWSRFEWLLRKMSTEDLANLILNPPDGVRRNE